MTEAAAFKATFAGLRSLTDGDYRISFDFKGEDLTHVVQVLAHGGKPSAAKGTWFAIARLNTGELGGDCDDSPTTGSHGLISTTGEGAARGSVTMRAALLSNKIYLDICNKPVGRKFLEEMCQDIVRGQAINDASFAKEVIKSRLGIASLSEVDDDQVVSAKAEELLRWYAGWQRGLHVEASRIQQENQA